MGSTTKKESMSPFQTSYLKSQHEKQKLNIESIMSLLTKYGSSLDLNILYREYLLTIMGQFLSGESCYYAKNENIGVFSSVMIYGRINSKNLPTFNLDSQLVDYLEKNKYPSEVSKLPDGLSSEDNIDSLKKNFEVISPLWLKNKLLGFVFLGKKISSEPYTDSELSMLHSFGVVSAMTFNHASLYQNAKLSIAEVNKLNNIRTDIINRITHEFRTPLTVIKGGLAALKLEGEQAEVIQWIKDSVERLEGLISSLLDLNESCLKDTIISLNDWDPSVVLQKEVMLYIEAATARNISIEIMEISPGSIPQLKITAERFRQILDNLIDNAIKFSKDSMTITLGFEQGLRSPREQTDGIRLPDWKEQFKNRVDEYPALSEIDLIDQMAPVPKNISGGRDSETDSNQRFVVFRITDGGIGIPAEEITSITEPFQQASNSPDLNVKGKGLGLSVLQKIISRWGGHVYCKSEEGQGTTFTVFLPPK